MENKEWAAVKEIFYNDDRGGIIRDEEYRLHLGKYYSYELSSKIKRVQIALSRYKFVAKLLAYKESVKVFEIGCSEALGGLFSNRRLISKNTGELILTTMLSSGIECV